MAANAVSRNRCSGVVRDRDLRRKGLYGRAPLGTPLGLDPLQGPALQPVDQEAQFLAHGASRRRAGCCQGQGEAPDLLALALVEIGEHLAEARHQIGFGKQEIDWQAKAQALAQLGQPPPHGLRGFLQRRGVGAGQLVGTKCHDDAVDRLARPVALQQIEKPRPAASSAERSLSWVVQRPAVSSSTASSVKNQSQLRVPPTPLSSCAVSSGNRSPD